MNKYNVVRPDYDETKVYNVEAWDEEDAAANVCDSHYSRWDYPSGPLFFVVTNVETDISVHVEITIEAVPSFRGEVIEYGPKRCEHKPMYRGNDGLCYGCHNKFAPVTKEEQERSREEAYGAMRASRGVS